MSYAAVNGPRIYYEDTGGENAIVFSHGYFMDHEMWAPQVEELGDDYRCITWDERCWGQTEHNGEPFDYWDLAEDCCGLLDQLGIDQAVVVGMSQGGFLSFRLALAHPERVKALVLIDTDPHPETDESKALYNAMYDQALADGITSDLAAAIAGILFGPEFDSSYWRAKMVAKPPAQIRRGQECLLGRDDISSRLGEITCPTLVVHGELDASFPIDGVDAWAAQMPGLTEVVRVPDAGHTSCLEKPAAVNPALHSFLKAL